MNCAKIRGKTQNLDKILDFLTISLGNFLPGSLQSAAHAPGVVAATGIIHFMLVFLFFYHFMFKKVALWCYLAEKYELIP